jgi:hypothetical protein
MTNYTTRPAHDGSSHISSVFTRNFTRSIAAWGVLGEGHDNRTQRNLKPSKCVPRLTLPRTGHTVITCYYSVFKRSDYSIKVLDLTLRKKVLKHILYIHISIEIWMNDDSLQSPRLHTISKLPTVQEITLFKLYEETSEHDTNTKFLVLDV